SPVQEKSIIREKKRVSHFSPSIQHSDRDQCPPLLSFPQKRAACEPYLHSSSHHGHPPAPYPRSSRYDMAPCFPSYSPHIYTHYDGVGQGSDLFGPSQPSYYDNLHPLQGTMHHPSTFHSHHSHLDVPFPSSSSSSRSISSFSTSSYPSLSLDFSCDGLLDSSNPRLSLERIYPVEPSGFFISPNSSSISPESVFCSDLVPGKCTFPSLPSYNIPLQEYCNILTNLLFESDRKILGEVGFASESTQSQLSEHMPPSQSSLSIPSSQDSFSESHGELDPIPMPKVDPLIDIDAEDDDNPYAVSEYVKEIYQYLLEAEQKGRPDPNYLIRQPDLAPKMRSILIDWISEVHTNFKLPNEALFLSVQICDRFLSSKKQVVRRRLQLLGIASLVIASKFEDSYTQSIDKFVYMTDGAFTRDELVQMEKVILTTLRFSLSFPTSITFLRRYAKIAELSHPQRYLSFLIAELCLMDIKMLKYRPSFLAAAAIYLSNVISGKDGWSSTLYEHTGYQEADVSALALIVKKSCGAGLSSRLVAIRRKYSSSRYFNVSGILKGFYKRI
ncbi:Cyclin like protein, partial [Aduncisulcus paluster]